MVTTTSPSCGRGHAKCAVWASCTFSQCPLPPPTAPPGHILCHVHLSSQCTVTGLIMPLDTCHLPLQAYFHSSAPPGPWTVAGGREASGTRRSAQGHYLLEAPLSPNCQISFCSQLTEGEKSLSKPNEVKENCDCQQVVFCKKHGATMGWIVSSPCPN